MEETHPSEMKPDEEDGRTRSPQNATVVRPRWQYSVALGGGLLCILSLVTLVFYLTHPPHASLSGTPSMRSNQRSALAKTTVAPAAMLPLQPLPCTVNLRTWTDGAPGWQVRQNVLLNTGTSSWNATSGPTIIAPCDVSSAAEWASTNIAVQTTIRVTGVQANACFGMTIRGTPTFSGWQGYKLGVGTCLGALDEVRVTGPDYLHDTQAKEVAFHPGSSVHTYRIEIVDTTIMFSIDGKLLLTTTDTRFLYGLEIGLWSQNTQLKVTSYTVTGINDDDN